MEQNHSLEETKSESQSSTTTFFAKNGNPVVSICHGHTGPEQFNKSLAHEGKVNAQVSNVVHEYWQVTKNGLVKSSKEAEGSFGATVVRWTASKEEGGAPIPN